MVNNAEYVTHVEREVNWRTFSENKELTSLFRRVFSDFSSKPKLVMCRPVLAREIQEGLNLSYMGSVWDEEGAPKITHILDGLWALVQRIQIDMELFNEAGRNPTNIINEIVAYNYYDCMSGGMPTGMLLGCRYIIETYNCDLTTPCYPGHGENPWYTLGDWMDSTKGASLEQVLPELDLSKILGLPAGT